MNVKGRIECESALVIDESFLKNVNNIITEYFIAPTYSARLKMGDLIEFDSLNELLEYDNFKDKKIISLDLNFGYYNSISICPFEVLRRKSIVVSYKIEDKEKNTLFREAIQNEIDKCKTSKIYSLISSISIAGLCIFFGIIALIVGNICYFQNSGNSYTFNFGIFELTIGYIIIVLYLCILFGLLLLVKYLFPSVVFYFGKEIDNNNKLKSFRANFFWCVIVAIAVSVLVERIL